MITKNVEILLKKSKNLIKLSKYSQKFPLKFTKHFQIFKLNKGSFVNYVALKSDF